MLYNRLLEERKLAYKLEKKSLNYYDQANTLSETEATDCQVLQQVVKRLDQAFQAFFRRVKQGENPGFPRFKPKQQYNYIPPY